MKPPAPYCYLVVEKFNSKNRIDFVVSSVFWSEELAAQEAQRVIVHGSKAYHRTEVYKILVPKTGERGYSRMTLAYEKDEVTERAKLVYESDCYFRSLS